MTDSKITVRLSDDLLDRVDSLEGSRSEITREALRNYVDRDRSGGGTMDDLMRKLVHDAVEDVVDDVVRDRMNDRDVNVNVNMPEGIGAQRDVGNSGEGIERAEIGGGERSCPQCGEEVKDEHVHCPNCGAKTSNRVFCDCGDEVRSDWAFCPSCGRRTPAGHALNR